MSEASIDEDRFLVENSRISHFIDVNVAKCRKIALVTSGGTTVPLDCTHATLTIFRPEIVVRLVQSISLPRGML